jgi:hypothetical protein
LYIGIFSFLFLILFEKSAYIKCFNNKYYGKNPKIARYVRIINYLIKKIFKKGKIFGKREFDIINSLNLENSTKNRILRVNSISQYAFKTINGPLKNIFLIIFLPPLVLLSIVNIYVLMLLPSNNGNSYNFTQNTSIVELCIICICLIPCIYINKYFRNKLPYEWRITRELISLLKDYSKKRNDIYEIVSTRVIEFKFRGIENILKKLCVDKASSSINNYSRADYLYLKVYKFIDINNFVEVTREKYFNFLCDLFQDLVLDLRKVAFEIDGNDKNIIENISENNEAKKYFQRKIILLSSSAVFLVLLSIFASIIFNNNGISIATLIMEYLGFVLGVIKLHK